MTPLEGGSRHYAGPDAALPPEVVQEVMAPPQPAIPTFQDPPPRLVPIHAGGRELDAAAAYARSQHGTEFDKEDLAQAFLAGIAYAQESLRQTVRKPHPTMPLMGTAESRTLAAALELFIDQFLIHLPPEEAERGEYLSVEDARTLADSIRRSER